MESDRRQSGVRQRRDIRERKRGEREREGQRRRSRSSAFPVAGESHDGAGECHENRITAVEWTLLASPALSPGVTRVRARGQRGRDEVGLAVVNPVGEKAKSGMTDLFK